MTPDLLPPIDQSAALQKKEEIDTLIGQINVHELRLARSYARLGSLLKDFKIEQFWIPLGFDRFSSFLESIWKALGKKLGAVGNGELSADLDQSAFISLSVTVAYRLACPDRIDLGSQPNAFPFLNHGSSHSDGRSRAERGNADLMGCGISPKSL